MTYTLHPLARIYTPEERAAYQARIACQVKYRDATLTANQVTFRARFPVTGPRVPEEAGRLLAARLGWIRVKLRELKAHQVEARRVLGAPHAPGIGLTMYEAQQRARAITWLHCMRRTLLGRPLSQSPGDSMGWRYAHLCPQAALLAVEPRPLPC